jgi:adenylate cyclase
MKRRLTAILSADVVGYSGLMERDEAGTVSRLVQSRASIFDPRVKAHGGRIVKLMGDGALVEFASVIAAVSCALEIQSAMEAAEKLVPEAERLCYRMGVNLGDVIVEDDDIYGEGVNVAARLQSLAPGGGVAISRTVRDQVAGKVKAEFDDLGEYTVKNIEQPVHVYTVRTSGQPAARSRLAAAKEVSIAVLPFVNMSGDPEQEYFSDGISEDIITDLSKVSALTVVSRNTAFTFKGKPVDISQVARQLKVGYVLEGSVRKAGNRVRITAQLIAGGRDTHVWAERYDRDLSDIFAVQEEISEAIVAALKLKLLPEEKKAIEHRSTSNPEAYKLYLQAKQYRMIDDTRQVPIAERFLRRAVELDPNYARAWAMLALVQNRLHGMSSEAENGRAAAAKALALDPMLAEAHAAQGRVLMAAGQLDEGIAEIETALKLDSNSAEIQYSAAKSYATVKRFADAVRHYERAAELNENDWQPLFVATSCYQALGESEKSDEAARRALKRVEQIVISQPDCGPLLYAGTSLLAQLGEKDRAKEWLSRALLVDPEDTIGLYNGACALLRLGEREAAIPYLKPFFASMKSHALLWVEGDPDLDPVRDHPAFKALLEEARTRIAAEAATKPS